MADTTPNQTFDNMNRQVDVMSYGPDAQSFIKDMMMGDVKAKGKPPGHTDTEDKGQYKKLEKVLEDIEESFSGILKDAEKSAKKIGEIYKKVSGSKAAPSGGKTKANIKAEFDGDDAEEGIEKLGDAAEDFGSRVTESIGKVAPATQEAAWHLRFLFNKVGQSMQKATNMMVGGIAAVTGGLSLGHMFEGVVGPTMQFQRSMRRTLQQTQGVGKSVVFMQEELTKVGDTVKFTGRMRHKFLKAYDANMKKGIRTQKETLKITRTGLGLANLIGDSTDSTAESMHDWSMQTGMTTRQVGALSYKIRDVAKMTGVTGENLANVVKQSAAMVQNFRNAGTFSVAIAGNIVAMNAAASKYGAEDYVSEFQKGLSGLDGWTNSSMQGLLAIGATASGMEFNVLDMPALLEDAEKTKNLLKGMESQMLGVEGRGRTFAEGNKFAAQSLEEITSGKYQTRMRSLGKDGAAAFNIIDQKMRDISGKGIGENAAGLTALKESFQTVGDRMGALNEKYKGNLSIEEARLYKEQQLETVLMSQISSLSDIGASQDPFEQMALKLGKMDEASLKHLGVSDQLIAQSKAEGKSVKDLMGLKVNPETGETKFIKSAGSMEAMSGVMQSMSNNVVQKMKQADMSASDIAEFANIDIEKAMSGDRGAMMNFMDKAQSAEQAAATKLQAKADPISDMAQTMMQVNDKMGQLVAATNNWFMRVFGKIGVIALILGGAVAGLVSGLATKVLPWVTGIKKGVARGGADAMKLRGVASGLQGIPGKITRAITGTNKVAIGPGMTKATKGVGGLAGKLEQVGAKGMANKVASFGDDAAKNLGKLGKSAKGAATKVGGLTKSMVKPLAAVGRVAAKSIPGVAKVAAVGARVAPALMGATKGLGVMLAPLNTIPGLGTAITLALGGVIGAFSTGARAAELYSTTQEKLTFNQKYAAQEAGFLTGALDMLTFGIFSKWVGPSGTWTKGLAQFFAALGPIRYIVTGPIRLLIWSFQVLWGVVKGLGVFVIEVFKGIWSGIKMALSPFMELGGFIMDIGSSIAGMLGQNAEGPSLLSKIGDVTEWIVGSFRILGKVVGWVAKAIGWLIKMALMPFLLMAKFLGAVLGGVVKGVILFAKAILKPFQQVWKSIKSIFSIMLEPLVEVWNSVKEIFGAIGGLFGSAGEGGGFFMGIMNGIATAFEWVGKAIGFVLNILIKGLYPIFLGLKVVFMALATPLLLVAKLIGNIAKVIKGELKISELFKGMGDILMRIPKMLWGVIEKIPGMIWSAITIIPKMLWGVVKKIPGMIWSAITIIPKMLWGVVKKIPGMIWSAIKGIGKMILKGIMYAIIGIFALLVGIPALIIYGIAKLVGLLWKGIKNITSALWSGVTSTFNYLIALPGKILEGIGSILSSIGDFIVGIPGMIMDGLAGLGNMIMDGLTAVFVDFPVMVRDGFMDALSGVWEWIKSWVPGAKGFSETAEESSVRIAEEGNSMVQGAGRAAGGAMDLITGGGEGRMAGLSKMAGGALEAGKALIGKLNPFSWFKEGTPMISKGGLAMVHAGEMIVPAGTPLADGKTGFGSSVMNTMTGSSLIKQGTGVSTAGKTGPALKATQGQVGKLASAAKDKLVPALKTSGKALGVLGKVGKSILGLGFKMAKMPFKMASAFVKMPFKTVGWAIKSTVKTMKALPVMGKSIATAFKAVKSGNILGAAKSLLDIPKTLAQSISPQWVKNVFGKVSGAIKSTTTLAATLGSQLYKMIPPSVVKGVQQLVTKIKNIVPALQTAKGKVVEFASKATNKLAPALETVKGQIGEFASKAQNKLAPALETVKGHTTELASKLQNKLGPAAKVAQTHLGKVSNALKHTFKAVKAGELAKSVKILKTIPAHMKNMVPPRVQKNILKVGRALKKNLVPALGAVYKNAAKLAAKLQKVVPPAAKVVQKTTAKLVEKVGPAAKVAKTHLGKTSNALKHTFKAVKAGELAKSVKILKTIPAHMKNMVPPSVQKNIVKVGGALNNMVPPSVQKNIGKVGGALKDKLGPAVKVSQKTATELASKLQNKLGPAAKVAQTHLGKVGGALKHTFKAVKAGELAKSVKILKTIPAHMKNMVPPSVQKNIGKVGGAVKNLSKLAGDGTGKVAKAANALKTVGKNAVESGSKVTKAALPALQKLGTQAGSAVAKAGGTIAKGAGTVAKVAGGTLAKGMGKAAGMVAGKAAGPFALAVGGAFGAAEAESLGMTKGKGAILGAITGGADTGSMLSGFVGVEKDSTADLAMGVAGAAATGALTGAAIGSVIPVVGTAVGAAVGGVIGAGTEVYKIFADPIDNFVGGALDAMGPLGDGVRAVGGVLSGAAGGIGSAIGDVAGGIWEGGKALLSGDIVGAVGSLAGGLWDAGGSLLGGIGDMASAWWDGAKSIGGGLADAGSYLLDGAANIGGNLLDGAGAVGDMAYDAAAAVGGKLADAGGKLMEGDVLGAAGDAATAGWAGVKSIGSSIGGWLGFAKGTPEVQSGGLAMIHPGEMIIPANVDVASAALGGVGKALEGSIGVPLSGIFGGFGNALAGLSGSGAMGGAAAGAMAGAALGPLGMVAGGVGGALLGGVGGGIMDWLGFGGKEEIKAPKKTTPLEDISMNVVAIADNTAMIGMLLESGSTAVGSLGGIGGIGGAIGGIGGAIGGIGSMASSWFGLGETATAASAVMPTADIHDRVQRDIAASRSSTSVGGKELSMISSSTDQQCATLVEIRDHLKVMREIATQSDTSSGGTSGEAGDTSSNIQPKSSPGNYTWQFGQHGQIGNKQVINPGT